MNGVIGSPLPRVQQCRLCFWPAILLMGVHSPGWLSAQQETVTHSGTQADLRDHEGSLGASAAEHWAFRPLRRPELPTVRHTDWVRQPIDCFLLARLEAEGREPAPPADRYTLLRRVFFDLTGLPPTPADIHQFASSGDTDSWDRLIDRLLASPEYGPRWAQFWLDLARFAETDGYEHDKIRTEAWKYRDWVIHAADSDMPYDQFVTAQIAGDLLQTADGWGAIPTAFCLSGPDMPDLNDQQERKHYVLNELTATVGSVFLGLQIGCAQCHDHKYDPISQADFYRLRAFFENTIKPQREQSLFCLVHHGDVAATSYVYARGDWQRPGQMVWPDVPRVTKLVAGPIGSQETSTGQGNSGYNRGSLAAWMANPGNGLVARVIANRVWQFHFGRGLCPTESDFGFAGEAPYHADLLDWLAAELIAHHWSLKHLHRLIVTSATYQQAADVVASRTQAGTETDRSPRAPDERISRLGGHFPRQRLQAEMIRDAMLLCAGKLNGERGGPGIRPPLEPAVQATLLKGQWEVTPRQADHYRRSIYIFARRNLRWPLFETFDRPDANQSCPRRYESTTALQALYLLNSPFSHDMARAAAEDVLDRYPLGDAAVHEAVLRTWGRPPSPAERARLLEFVHQQMADFQLSPTDAFADLFLALFNTNEFLYLE